MKKIHYLSTLFFCLLIFQINAQTETPRLLDHRLVKTFTKEQLLQTWEEQGIPQAIAPVNYAVDVYEVIYNTCWHDSSCIKASGYYFVPKKEKASPMIVYHHGTQIERKREVKLGGELGICVGFATDGYAVAFPHYIGLGKGEKFHLYHHVPTEAYASMDLLRAIRQLNKQEDINVGSQLFSTGYSQGGHACMAFQKVVEADAALHEEFPILASAPMSGAYDLTGVQKSNMFEPYSHPGYLPYLLISYQEVYDLYDNFESIVKSPYDSTVLPLFNGEYSMDAINEYMPKIPKDFVEQEVVDEYLSNPEFPFKVALLENSTHNWIPKAPMLLCYCEGDEQVNYRNSVVAHKSMKDLGAKNVRKLRVAKGMGHNDCALFAVLHTKMYFDSFMKGSKKGRKGPIFKRFLIGLGKGQLKKQKRKEKKKKEGKGKK